MMTDSKWSPAEKKVARRAFDLALSREYATLLQRIKGLAARADEPEDLWAIRNDLTEQLQAIDRTYDYRYSQLLLVFGKLRRNGWLEKDDLVGLSEEKLRIIGLIAAG